MNDIKEIKSQIKNKMSELTKLYTLAVEDRQNAWEALRLKNKVHQAEIKSKEQEIVVANANAKSFKASYEGQAKNTIAFLDDCNNLKSEIRILSNQLSAMSGYVHADICDCDYMTKDITPGSKCLKLRSQISMKANNGNSYPSRVKPESVRDFFTRKAQILIDHMDVKVDVEWMRSKLTCIASDYDIGLDRDEIYW